MGGLMDVMRWLSTGGHKEDLLLACAYVLIQIKFKRH